MHRPGTFIFGMQVHFLPIMIIIIIYLFGNKDTRSVQKVRRLTQLTTRYPRHILSLFNIFSCKCNALGPAFLKSSDSAVEELLFLVFQPAICHADNVLVVRNFVSFREFFQFKKQIEVTWSQHNLITRQLKHWLPSKMSALSYSVTHFIRHSCSYCTTDGWLKDQ